MSYTALLNADSVPQSEPLNTRQVKNSAGGFVYAIDDFARLARFLVLGSASGTYYQRAPKLTRENAACVEACYAADPERTVALIVDYSVNARAPKVDAILFALALGALSDKDDTRKAVYAALPAVCRTASHLFEFIANVTSLGRGWGRGFKRAVANWYSTRNVDALAYQMIKYRERHGFNHRDMLRLAHPVSMPDDTQRRALYAQVAGAMNVDVETLPAKMRAHLQAMATTDEAALLKIMRTHDLPWEAIPTSALTSADVWRTMLPSMKMTALVRNLGTLTRLGVLSPLSDELDLVVSRLGDVERLKKERIHPFQILLALATYRKGRGDKGKTTWTPVAEVSAALDGAFYKAFASVVPTNKRHLLAIDVSGSMDGEMLGSSLTAREAAAALAMVTVETETRTHVVGFSHGLVDIKIAKGMQIAKVIKKMSEIQMGTTDCAKPILYALDKKIPVDVFVVITDNETWSGSVHPMEALRRYRRAFNANAKLVVIGLTSTEFSIADPNDFGTLDIVGFDSGAPQVMADFVR